MNLDALTAAIKKEKERHQTEFHFLIFIQSNMTSFEVAAIEPLFHLPGQTADLTRDKVNPSPANSELLTRPYPYNCWIEALLLA